MVYEQGVHINNTLVRSICFWYNVYAQQDVAEMDFTIVYIYSRSFLIVYTVYGLVMK